jgi:uncharacterized protein involved in type VI secretion and phage assembly
MVDREMENLVVELTEFVRNRYFGKYRGLVRNVDDPENMGRIIAQVPEVYEDEDSPWALPSVPFAGQNHGLVVLPEVGDGVWIEFEAGDPSCPIWTGCWWASGEMPSPGGKAVRVLATTAGHKVILDDDGSKLQLLHSGGAEITMTDNDITLKIGSTQIVLSASGVNINNGAFEVR